MVDNLTDYEKRLMHNQLNRIYADQVVVYYNLNEDGSSYIFSSGSDLFYDVFGRQQLLSSGSATLSGTFVWRNYASMTMIQAGLLESADALFVTDDSYYGLLSGVTNYITKENREMVIQSINKGLRSGQLIVELVYRKDE